MTYNDEHLPNGLYYPDFSGFMKRLRRLDGTPGVKLYVAGEYGEKSGREHFHVLFYNHKYDIELVERAWRDPNTDEDLGFVHDGTLTPQSMKYVSGYVSKRGYDPKSGKRPPFGRMSVRLPDGLSEDEILDMCRTGLISYNGRKFLVPTNWRRRYHELWKQTQPARAYNQTFDAEGNRREKKDWKPEVVSAMMDLRKKKQALKKRKKV